MNASPLVFVDRASAGRPPRLTPTEIKVLTGVRSGQLNKQIAHDLGIAEKTVKAHMTMLMRKLNVRNRTQAAIAASALSFPTFDMHPKSA